MGERTPINRAKSFKCQCVTLNVISATEENSPPEVKPIAWLWWETIFLLNLLNLTVFYNEC